MPIRPLIILALALAMLSGCGRRGDLEPAGTPETNAVPTGEATTAAPAAIPPAAPDKAPDRRFILDPLI
jgi:hypothetical protein